ncbi:MAG: restriction endonuclease subunit S, partial [Anaerolineae bacterium]|nr:restriction endonuclease subunit S [Anaerolineae bacterium]
YAYHVMNAPFVQDYLKSISKGTTFKEITLGMLQRLPIPVPNTLTEQEAISRFASHQESVFDKLIQLEENNINNMHEYRTRLIADVVTGKVDVRGLVFEMPDEFEDDVLLDVDEDDLQDEDELEEAFDAED